MSTVTISAAGAHASAVATDRIPASKAGVKGYLTPLTIATYMNLSPATNEIAVVNGTSAQTLRVYNTFTDASNYERLNILWTSNIARITTAGAGTGVTTRNMQIRTGGLGTLAFGVNATNYWELDTSGHFIATTDNTNDIGASGATRPRNIYVGTGITAGGGTSIYAATAIPAGGTAGSGYKFSSTTNFGVFFGSGAPSLSAAKGSLYLRSDGTGVADRAYINTNGSTTWTALTTAG